MKNNVKKITTAAMCIAIGVVLPMAIHFIPNGGSILLPMHVPILICGMICGWKYGMTAGILTPIISSSLTGMPPAGYLPVMIIELAVYGLVSGLVIGKVKSRSRAADLYLTLITAMISGRIVMGIANALIFRIGNYGLQIWIGSAFVTALPGIIIQLLLIPAIVMLLEKAKVIGVENA